MDIKSLLKELGVDIPQNRAIAEGLTSNVATLTFVSAL
jgi:hypothetical protein